MCNAWSIYNAVFSERRELEQVCDFHPSMRKCPKTNIQTFFHVNKPNGINTSDNPKPHIAE